VVRKTRTQSSSWDARPPIPSVLPIFSQLPLSKGGHYFHQTWRAANRPGELSYLPEMEGVTAKLQGSGDRRRHEAPRCEVQQCPCDRGCSAGNGNSPTAHPTGYEVIFCQPFIVHYRPHWVEIVRFRSDCHGRRVAVCHPSGRSGTDCLFTRRAHGSVSNSTFKVTCSCEDYAQPLHHHARHRLFDRFAKSISHLQHD